MAIAGTASEGNLEAPTRHPIDWKNPDFYDEKKCMDEVERIFDICHGCRRCVSLCGAFPKLFDLVDESPTMELDGVPREKYWEVIDQCYLCDMCYMSKCPYTPPHEFNLDFPHTMLRAKAIKFKQGGASFRDKMLSSTDAVGSFAGIPVVTQSVNAINGTKTMRSAMESSLGVDQKAWIPSYAKKKFRSMEKAHRADKVIGSANAVDGERTPGKVVIYSTCYVNYNEPGIGQDLVKILNHNNIPYLIAEKEACCGMPKLELGDLDSVAKLAEKNIPALAKLAKQGYAIVTPIPSCTLMFKQELPLMFPDDPDVQAVKAAMWDPFQYFVARSKDGLLKTDFPKPLGNVSYHVPCHGRVQNIGKKTEEMLKMIPDTAINTVERCSGHSGTWGVKKEFHEMAMKIGKPVFKQMANKAPDYISSDCQLAGHHIEQGIAELGDQVKLDKQPQMAHPLTLLRMAYGLE